MNTMNNIVNEQLKCAMGALHHLSDVGATVRRVSLGECQPLIEIDAAPGAFAQGALAARITRDGVQRRTLIARVCGCTVQWTEQHAVAVRP
jgi:hypothetical protein